jgi:hypothetical protein
LAASPIAAVDFGGTIGNTTEVSVPTEGGDTNLGQSNRLSLFVSHAFSEELEFMARGRYQYRIDQTYGNNASYSEDWWQGDVDAFYLRGRYPLEQPEPYLLDFQVGRFRLREFSGAVLNERADSLRVTFQTGEGEMTLAGGYTGLLQKESSNILISKKDVEQDANDDYYRAPDRLLGLFSFSIPNLGANQGLDIAFIGQGDLRQDADLNEDQGAVHTVHMGGGIDGPIVSGLFYDLYGYFGGGRTMSNIEGVYQYETIRSWLAGANLQYFIPEAARSVVSLGYIWSSGDSDHGSFYEGNTEDSSTQFIGLTPPSFGLVFSPRLGNLMVTDLSYSIKPFADSGARSLEEFQAELSGYGFFRTTTGVISEPGINPASKELYLGSEFDLALNFRPFSDLGFSIVNGFFIPNNQRSKSAFLDEAVEMEYKGQFTATFSF